MPLDFQMSKLRQQLAEFEIEPPARFAKLLPHRDGRPGKCFEAAEHVILNADVGAGLVLVHGTCRAPSGGETAHAWIEVPGSLVYDAVLGRIYGWDVYQEKLQAIPFKRYSVAEVVALVKTTDTHGPWTEEEERQARNSDASA